VLDPFTVVDGGLSTALADLGAEPTGALWTAQLVLDRPELVIAAHRSFLEAGADVIISASYQASEPGFVEAGCTPIEARAALASTTELARRSGARFVAASVGPYGATLGDGSEYHGRYTATWGEVRAFHRARLRVLATTGPDLFAIETIPTTAEAEIVLEELEAATDAQAWIAFSCVDAGVTCGGDAVADAVSRVAGVPSLAAVGVNCTSPAHVADALRAVASATALPLVVYPNHGRAWDATRRCWTGDEHDGPAAHVAEWLSLGARLVGGCCGVGARAIGELAEARGRDLAVG
jgi:S-methylmethionine-dependent homocysteine/selenocysteine methylase